MSDELVMKRLYEMSFWNLSLGLDVMTIPACKDIRRSVITKKKKKKKEKKKNN